MFFLSPVARQIPASIKGRRLLFAVYSLIAFLIALPQVARATQPPNIILILTDDQAWNTLGYMPKLQAQLVPQAVTFNNAFSVEPLCCPSRASILTGRYPQSHGVLGNVLPFGGSLAFYDASTLPVWLQSRGYRTAMLGKYFNDYLRSSLYIPPGWNEWQAFQAPNYYSYKINANGVLESYGTTEADYSTDVLATKAVRFIENAAGQPFFLYFAPFAPHLPYQPAPRHIGRYADVPPYRPPNYDEADVSDKPLWVRQLQQVTASREAQNDQDRQAYLEMLLGVDDALDAILKALDSTNQRSNTVIIFVSDNGYTWGEHRWYAKGCSYEESLRIPLLVHYPGVTTSQRQESRLVLNIDLAPTIAEIAGASVPATVEGRSLLPLLRSEPTNWRDSFMFQGWELTPTHSGVRTSNYKYLENIADEREFYDLLSDPFELTNQFGNPRFASISNQLREKMIAARYRPDGLAPYLLVHATAISGGLLPEVGIDEPSVLRTDMSLWPNQYRVYRKSGRSGELRGQATFRSDLFPETGAIALRDINGNGAFEIALQSRGAIASDRMIEVRDSATGELLREVAVSDQVLKIDAYPDLDGNGSPEIVLVRQKPWTLLLVDLKTGQQTSFALTPPGGLGALTFALVPDTTGDFQPEVAVAWGGLGGGGLKIQLYNPASGVLLKTIVGTTMSGVPGLWGIQDTSGNGAPEVAVLEGNQPVSLTLYDTASGRQVRKLDIPKLVYIRAGQLLSDSDGNGSPEIALLGVTDTRRNQVVVADLTSAALRRILFDSNALAADLEVLADTNDNGKPELAVLLANPETGTLQLQVRDGTLGDLIRNINYP